MALLSIKDLNFKYAIDSKFHLDNVNLEINKGDFVLLCGPSGCGKTTFLRMIKRELRPNGQFSGSIIFDGKNLEELDDKEAASLIGYVMQNPDLSIATDKVWHELAFGLESLDLKTNEIRKKVSEISSFFGINDWYNKNTSELSGGQKQLLSLASILVMNPKLLLLDEPTAQLDPIASVEFINSLKKINDELGITIIIVEHRVEELFPLVNKVLMMDKGKIVVEGSPKNISNQIDNNMERFNLLLPTVTRLFNHYKCEGESPLTVKEGKDFIKSFKNNIKTLERENIQSNNNVALQIVDGYFRYEKDSKDVLDGLSIDIYENEILTILGSNGAGKTTLLKVLSGLKRLYRGKYRLWDKKIKEYDNNSLYRHNLALLPQNPSSLFVKNKVKDDLYEMVKFNKDLDEKIDEKEIENKLNELINKLEIQDILESHPFDLSGGEMQKCALAKILVLDPKIILLDEPTKGLDPYSKESIIKIIKQLKKEGKTIVIVSHDIEFSAKVSDRCAMFFNGEISSIGKPYEFFSNNNYYTTIISRVSREYYDNIVTLDDMIKIIDLNK